MKSGRSDRDVKPSNISVVVVRREREPCARDRQLIKLLVDLLDKPDTPGEVPRP